MEILKPFQIAIASDLIKNYIGSQPLHQYLAEQFKQHKNWGSRDRKIYRELVFSFYRLGGISKSMSVENAVLFAHQNKEDLLSQIDLHDLFLPYQHLSTLLDRDNFVKSLLYNKSVYLKIIGNHFDVVVEYLNTHNIEFYGYSTDVLRLSANSKCDDIIANGWAIVMDISSQKCIDKVELFGKEWVLDCCSGAGGKSLFIKNKYPQIQLTCNDIRYTIIENLKSRFRTCKIEQPICEVHDFSKEIFLDKKFDCIVADVPCSGSGTWGRAPENILYFNQVKVQEYALLQRKIVKNAIKLMKPTSSLYYITCSVFSEENEKNIDYFKVNYGLKCHWMEYVNEDGNNSDWLFVSQLTL